MFPGNIHNSIYHLASYRPCHAFLIQYLYHCTAVNQEKRDAGSMMLYGKCDCTGCKHVLFDKNNPRFQVGKKFLTLHYCLLLTTYYLLLTTYYLLLTTYYLLLAYYLLFTIYY